MKSNLQWFSLGLGLLFLPTTYGLPVVAVADILHQTKVLSEQLVALKEQLQIAKKSLRDVEGAYGYGSLLDSEEAFAQRQWGPQTWEQALNGADHSSDRQYQQLFREYQTQHPTLPVKSYQQGASASLAKRYREMVVENNTAGVFSNYEYKQVNTYLKEVHQLSKKIEEAKNAKAAIDLNSRLIAELSYIAVESLKMQTLINHQMVDRSRGVIEAKERESVFNRLPQEKEVDFSRLDSF